MKEDKKNKKVKKTVVTTTTTTTVTSVVTEKTLDTNYLLILDRSGSMSSCWKSTISGLNEQLGTIRALEIKYPEQRYFISLVVFDNEIETIIENKPVSEVNDFDGSEFPPRGGTALHDAIGVGISNLKMIIDRKNKESDNISTALVVIMTDGEENSSKEHTSTSIKKIVDGLEKTKAWTFSYMGANQDAILTARNFGISAGNSVNYSSTASGAHSAAEGLSKAFACRASSHAEGYATAGIGSMTLDSMELNNTSFMVDAIGGTTISENSIDTDADKDLSI